MSAADAGTIAVAIALDASTIEAIAQRTAELLRAPAPTGEILTSLEARAYVKRRSSAAFSEWCARYYVKPYQKNRYSKTRLDVALALEARKRA